MSNDVISSFCDNRLVPTIRLIFSQWDLISMSATPRGRCFCDARRIGTSDDSKGGEFVLEVDDEDDVDDATVVALFRRMNGSFCEGLSLLTFKTFCFGDSFDEVGDDALMPMIRNACISSREFQRDGRKRRYQ